MIFGVVNAPRFILELIQLPPRCGGLANILAALAAAVVAASDGYCPDSGVTAVTDDGGLLPPATLPGWGYL